MKLKWTAALFLSASLLVPAAASASTSAEDKYPDGPIRILVGYSPSGAADIIARLFTEAFSRHLDQTVIVENRPGAGSTLASRALAQSEPDGYTLALASGTLYGIDQFLLEVDYTPQDFTPLTRLTVSPLILAVGPELGVSTVSELMDKAKASSRGLNYSSSGIGGSPHVAASMFEKQVGSEMIHVPYKGGAAALQDVANGRVDFSFGTAASVLPLAQQGKLKMLGVSTIDASPVAPELEPLDKLGMPGFDFFFWFGLFGPAGMPDHVQSKLFDAAQKALNEPELQAKLLKTGNVAAPSSSQQEFEDWATDNGAMMLERLKQTGVTR